MGGPGPATTQHSSDCLAAPQAGPASYGPARPPQKKEPLASPEALSREYGRKRDTERGRLREVWKPAGPTNV
eukprot:6492178-Pyramimonas_sp.AAC.1